MSSKSAGSQPNFDRIRPPKPAPTADAATVNRSDSDLQGKRALFSGAEQPPAMGSVAIECSKCSTRSVVSLVHLARLAAGGLVMPVPGISKQAWIVCPACKKRSWMSVTVRS